MLFNWQF